ncbi:AAA family ATPase [Actinomyces johnsonii]|uniref:AAA family ATPase n=1 Tax=Actinomyces johnsonii TaxID=544581 RepID=A0A507ZYU2_9ACTO|nr:AAA family ATPase [Actinomyces johnsonii]KAA8739415.1 AAA family ATPase [Actinomyces johnsonii]TQD42689.1 AAA family ATPase [Actinomyces johnsonii]
MQITRIKQIKDYRIFRNWRQHGNTDFARFNVIYGGNGSGKSTLAALLTEIAKGDWSDGTILTVKDENQHARDIRSQDEALATRLCIFNANYVEENLRFDTRHPKSLLYLGKENIDNQKLREELEKAIDEANSSTIPQLKKQFEAAGDKCNEIGTKGAAKVAGKLQGVDVSYDGRRYKRPKFIKALDDALQSPSRDMSEFDVDQQIKRIASPTTDRITELSNLSIPLADIDAQVSRVLAQTVTSEAIDALKSNHQAAAWVQEGMQLHRAGDRCLFCEGVYTEQRIDRLNRHFDKSLRQVQQAIETLDTQLVGCENQCEQFEKVLDPPKSLDEARTKCWLDHTDAIRVLIAAVKERLVFLRQQLARKQGELFQPLTLEKSSTDSSLSGNVDVEALNAIIREHNNDIDNYDQLKKQVCNDVVQYYIEEVRAEYSTVLDAIQNIQDSLATAKQQRDDNSTELQRLKNSQQDRAHFAQLLTTDLHRYFGRDELTFELSDDNGYLIQRNGQKAAHLSEGEQRSIALLYFLRDIESNGANLRERIVVFDDPVSSVDDGAATGAFAYIWDKCIGKKQNGVGQLIVLTHNFDFFRHWVNRLASLKKMSEDESNLVSYSVSELRVNSRFSSTGVPTRAPDLVRWDKPWKYALLRSEYHYLFWRAATELQKWHKCSSNIMKEYDAAILPNVCRRLLEGFSSFRCPQKIGNFEAQMKEMLDQSQGSAERTYLVRFLHEYSHNEQCDPSKHIQLLETPKIIESIFSLIQELDPNHYSAMCEALHVSPLAASDNDKANGDETEKGEAAKVAPSSE